jgi:hypothetical protein
MAMEPDQRTWKRSMNDEQKKLTKAAEKQPGEYRVGWYALSGEPYHVRGCRFFPRDNQFVWYGFGEPEDAERAGHPPAKCCMKQGDATFSCPTCSGTGRVKKES